MALKGVHPGNGTGLDADALSAALSDARRWHREHADFALCLELIDLELGFTTTDTRRADLLHEKGRLLSDELLRDEAGQAAVRQALEAVGNHKASRESLAQMTLVRANWEPILPALPEAGRGGQGSGARLQPARLGRRVLSQVPADRPRGRGPPPQEPGARRRQPPLGRAPRAGPARGGAA